MGAFFNKKSALTTAATFFVFIVPARAQNLEYEAKLSNAIEQLRRLPPSQREEIERQIASRALASSSISHLEDIR